MIIMKINDNLPRVVVFGRGPGASIWNAVGGQKIPFAGLQRNGRGVGAASIVQEIVYYQTVIC